MKFPAIVIALTLLISSALFAETPDIEIYHHARGPAENLDVLSFTQDAGTNMRWPIEWTVGYGKGRVYTATYCHVWKDDSQPERMRCAAMQTLMKHALWRLARRNDMPPVPADFPSENAVSIRKEIRVPQKP